MFNLEIAIDTDGLNLLLPVGHSFIIFQSCTYLFDVYDGLINFFSHIFIEGHTLVQVVGYLVQIATNLTHITQYLQQL